MALVVVIAGIAVVKTLHRASSGASSAAYQAGYNAGYDLGGPNNIGPPAIGDETEQEVISNCEQIPYSDPSSVSQSQIDAFDNGCVAGVKASLT